MAWIEVHQGLREHRKTYACAEMLNISRVTMVGTLVCLWLWALDNTPDGCLDGISNRTIARVCDWPEKKADKLMDALLKCGWLETDGDVLRIHDWTEYAGKLMERRAKDKERKKTSRANPEAVRKTSAGCPPDVQEKSCATVPIPYPTVPNRNNSGNKPDSVCPSAEKAPVKEGRAFTSFWEAYPNKADRDDAWDAWRTLNPDAETVRAIQAGLEGWKQSGQWLDDGGRFIPAAAKWLSKRRWEAVPPPAAAGKKDVPMGASGRLGEAELEAIRRVLAQPLEDCEG